MVKDNTKNVYILIKKFAKGFFFLLLAILAFDISAQEMAVCSDDKITNGEFDGLNNWIQNVGWENSVRWATNGAATVITSQKKAYPLKQSIFPALCSKGARKVVFDFRFERGYYGQGLFLVKLGGRTIGKIDFVGWRFSGAFKTINSPKVSVRIKERGGSFVVENISSGKWYTITLETESYEKINDVVNFIAKPKKNKSFCLSSVAIDNVKMYELFEKGSPDFDEQQLGVGQTFDLTVAQPNYEGCGEYVWSKNSPLADQTVPSQLTEEATSASVDLGSYYLYYKVAGRYWNASKKIVLYSDLDSDGDGVFDYSDKDDDNDGIWDEDEGSNIEKPYPVVEGTGEYASQFLIFDWKGATLDKGRRTATATKFYQGVLYTAKITIDDIPDNNSMQSNKLNTWEGGSSEMLVNYANYEANGEDVQGALYTNHLYSEIRFTVKVSGTLDGVDETIDVIPFDAESTTGAEEVSFKTSGTAFTLIDTIGNWKDLGSGIKTMQENAGIGKKTLKYSAITGARNMIASTQGKNIVLNGLLKASGGKQAFAIGVRLKELNNQIVSNPELDTDSDGIPNRLDLDSDNDGCFDAIEGNTGGTSITPDDLTNGHICASSACVNSDGVPMINGVAVRQTIGTSQVVSQGEISLIKSPQNSFTIASCDAAFSAKGQLSGVPSGSNLYYEWQYYDGTRWTTITRRILDNFATVDFSTVTGVVQSGEEVVLRLSNIKEVADGKKFRIWFKTASNPCGQLGNEASLIVEEIPSLVIPSEPIVLCVQNIDEVGFAETLNGDMKTPPDYYEMLQGDTSLDVETNYELWWIIKEGNQVVDTKNNGTFHKGQPSWINSSFRLWLKKSDTDPSALYQSRELQISYWGKACNSYDFSKVKTRKIIIVPRPRITIINK